MPSPEFDPLLAMLRARPARQDSTLEQLRADFEQVADFLPLPEGASHAPVDAGDVPAEWVRSPHSDEDRTLLYLHGGGYVVGSLRTHRALAARLAEAAGARVLSVDYRLAPEHPHPAAVDDTVAAWHWLLEGGADPGRSAVVGDSAGGGLGVATLLALRDAGAPQAGAGVCLSPWVDLEGTGASVRERAEQDPLVRREGLLGMARAYLGGLDPRTPLAAPLHAELGGLPPLLIHVGTAEILLDDAVRLAERARAAGVDVELETWEEMVHVWHMFGGLLPEADLAIARVGEFLRKHLG